MSEEAYIPQLRFSEFSGRWKESRIGNIYKDLRTGSTPSREVKSYFKGETPWITSGELKYNRISTTFEQISDEAIKDTNLVLYQPGTLFIAITGLEAPGTRGKCAINAVPSTTNQSCLAFRKVDSVDTIYMFYWYLKYGIPLYFKYAQGTKQQSFNNKIVEKFQIFLPTRPEQQKIAAFLTAVDNKIEQLSKKQELLGAYKKGLMQQIFSQAIRFKADDGSTFPDWEEKIVGDIGKVSMCKRILKNQTTTYGDIPFYKIGTFGKETDAYIGTELFEEFKTKYSFPNKGDILISASGTIGRTVVYDGSPAYFQDSNIVWIANDEELVSNKFLLYCYKNTRWNTENTTIARLYNENLRSIPLVLPSKSEQQKIANFLSSIDNKIEQVGKQLDESKQFKKALLQQMFV